MINEVKENALFKDLTKNFRRSGSHINHLHESDSEIVIFEDTSGKYLAVTIDSISEEIKSGLYSDPYLIGWMSVMINLSDLAAVGAEPVGILISEIFPDNLPEDFIWKIQKGISDAANQCNTFIIGGDTNSGDSLVMTGCAIGKCNKKYLTRIGGKPGEILYSSGKAGKGNSYALTNLFEGAKNDFRYFPQARIEEGLIVREFASSCMDTSDGFISTLDQLLRLNKIGFELDDNWVDIIDPDSIKVARESDIPFWLLLAGQHGEFELIFTIKADKEKQFLDSADKINWSPIKLGKVIREPSIRIRLNGYSKTLDGGRIRNAAFYAKGNVHQYLNELLKYNEELMSF